MKKIGLGCLSFVVIIVVVIVAIVMVRNHRLEEKIQNEV